MAAEPAGATAPYPETSPRWNPKGAPNLRGNDYGPETSEEETQRVEEEEEASSLEEFCGSE